MCVCVCVCVLVGVFSTNLDPLQSLYIYSFTAAFHRRENSQPSNRTQTTPTIKRSKINSLQTFLWTPNHRCEAQNRWFINVDVPVIGKSPLYPPVCWFKPSPHLWFDTLISYIGEQSGGWAILSDEPPGNLLFIIDQDFCFLIFWEKTLRGETKRIFVFSS